MLISIYMEKTQLAMEIVKLVISFLTPILVIGVGVVVARKIERSKLDVLKEKEWQVKWADLFFAHATEFNNIVTVLICSLFSLQKESDQQKINKIIRTISAKSNRLSEIDWNIQNYSQFSKNYGKEVITTQKKLMEGIRRLISEKGGNLEEIRTQQFEYNDAVRKAHSEILKMI